MVNFHHHNERTAVPFIRLDNEKNANDVEAQQAAKTKGARGENNLKKGQLPLGSYFGHKTKSYVNK